jgi:aldehyde:ferredoxin oxidoreductase
LEKLADLKRDIGEKLAAVTEEVADCRKDSDMAAMEMNNTISDLRASFQAMEESLAQEMAGRDVGAREMEMVMTELAARVQERVQSCEDLLTNETKANLGLHQKMEVAVQSLKQGLHVQTEVVARLEEHVSLASTLATEEHEMVAQLMNDVLGQKDHVAKLAEQTAVVETDTKLEDNNTVVLSREQEKYRGSFK